MNTTQPLNKILFLLDEISACKQRISMATDITRDIEMAVLQAKTVELYAEIQQYNRQALQPSATQIPVNHHQAAPQQNNYQPPVRETYAAPKPEAAAPIKQEPVVEKIQPLREKPEPVAETPKPEEKQPKPIHPQPTQPVQERSPVQEEPAQHQPPRRDVSDFEKKREKLMREEEEFKAKQQAANQATTQHAQETKQPEPVQEKPSAPKPEPSQQPELQSQAETPKPEPQAAQEPAKSNVSQFSQARENTATPGTEKSLNERLAAQQRQTSLNDKFQTNVKKNLADKLKLSPISDLRTAININQRVAFINQLFKGDDKEFKNVVNTVNGFRNFSEAKFFVQSEIAPRYNWNEEEPAVQDFMELVYRKFL